MYYSVREKSLHGELSFESKPDLGVFLESERIFIEKQMTGVLVTSNSNKWSK